MNFLELLFALLVGHALCDFPLQGDYLSRGKNHKQPIPGSPWWILLIAHALIHGGAVALVTGSVAFGVAETVVHALIDRAKCNGDISYEADQAAHVLFKILWAGLLVIAGAPQ